jgi:(p)ppGpp synthase/HD superfamily hydrolase
MTNQLQLAWQLAARHHDGQRYSTPTEGDTVPYLTHLGAVLIEAQEALLHEPGLDRELTLLCAILHDSLEDTELLPVDIEDHFGPAVLAGVKALTKDESLPTKREQMEDSLDRILAQPEECAVVKLCDRICNLVPPPAHWDDDKISAYRNEAQLILDRLGHTCPFLATRLAQKIAAYPAG